MLMDTGGNSGNQSSTLIIRGLALGEINIKGCGIKYYGKNLELVL